MATACSLAEGHALPHGVVDRLNYLASQAGAILTLSWRWRRADEEATEQRYEQIAEYAKLAKEKREAEKPSRRGQVLGGRRKEGGDSLAARDLGLSRQQVAA
jgi:hypothetical protein